MIVKEDQATCPHHLHLRARKCIRSRVWQPHHVPAWSWEHLSGWVSFRILTWTLTTYDNLLKMKSSPVHHPSKAGLDPSHPGRVVQRSTKPVHGSCHHVTMAGRKNNEQQEKKELDSQPIDSGGWDEQLPLIRDCILRYFFTVSLKVNYHLSWQP